MGRTRLPLKLIPDANRRRATYRKRISGLKKKAFELSTLCGIGVALVSFGPDGQLHTWPEDERGLVGIVKKFIGLNKEEQTKRQVTLSYYLKAQLQSSTSETVEARDEGLAHQSQASIACDAFDNIECYGTSFDELLPSGEDWSFSQNSLWQSKDYSGDRVLDPISEPLFAPMPTDDKPHAIWAPLDYSGDQAVLDHTSEPLFAPTDDKRVANSSSWTHPMSSDPTIGFDGFGDAISFPLDYSGDQVLDPTSEPLFAPTVDKQVVNSSSWIPMSLVDPTIGFDGFADAFTGNVFSSPSRIDRLMGSHYTDDGATFLDDRSHAGTQDGC